MIEKKGYLKRKSRYDKFRAFLVARAEKNGIEVIFKNPFATSVIGMVKYMPKYGLNSAFAAAMVIARRALGFSERIPRCYWSLIGISTESPEDGLVQSWGQWGKLCKLLSEQKIPRHQMFEPANVLEALQLAVSRTQKTFITVSKGKESQICFFISSFFKQFNLWGVTDAPNLQPWLNFIRY